MKHWLVVLAVVGFIAYALYQRPAKYAGMVSSGWGGNRAGNQPTLLDPHVAVGQATGFFGTPALPGYGVGAQPVGTN